MSTIKFEQLFQSSFIPPAIQMGIIIILLLCIPTGAKFIIQKITKSKPAGTVAFIVILVLISVVSYNHFLK